MTAKLRLYLYYLVSTFSYRTFASWERAGMPNPFLKNRQTLEETCRKDISDTFADQLREVPVSRAIRRISGPNTRDC